MMLIDADKLVKTFCSHCVDHDECKSECMDLKIIKSMKTVDAEPIRHGYWIKDRLDSIRKCSLCGAVIYRHEDLFDYCPWCGTRMDEVEEDE